MNGTGSPPLDPSPPYKVMTKEVGEHEFTAGFYPGFASSITVNGVSVYEQKADGPFPFVLPPGETRPYSSSSLNLSSTRGYRLALCLDDPNHVIVDITLRLRDPKSEESVARSVVAFQSDVDEVVIRETPTLCPPFC
jgi:hypothetical protein